MYVSFMNLKWNKIVYMLCILLFSFCRLSNPAVTVVRSLLIKNPKTRCCCSQGIKEMQHLPFFSDLDWDALLNKTIKAPYVPEIGTEFDVSSFESTFTREAAVDSVADKGSGTDKNGKKEG